MNTMNTYTAAQVAEWFLDYAKGLTWDDDVEHISNLKLQKLLYYAHAASLSLYNKPLFKDPIVHWTHGPAVPNIYYKYAKFRGNPIVFEGECPKVFDGEAKDFLEEVYKTFGCFTAWELRKISLAGEALQNTEVGEVLTDEIIKDSFDKEWVDAEESD